MQPSIFNVRVPFDGRDAVFLMNTFTDAQLIVSRDVSDLLDRIGREPIEPNDEEREAFQTLVENGFLVEDRETDRRNIENFFTAFRSSSDQLRVSHAMDRHIEMLRITVCRLIRPIGRHAHDREIDVRPLIDRRLARGDRTLAG